LSSGVPVRIVALCRLDEVAHLASATRGRVPNRMREFMGEPQWQELGVEAQTLSFRIRDGGEVLETGEGDATPVDDQLAGIGRSDAHHEHDVDVDVLVEKLGTTLFSRASKRDDIRALEHLEQVCSVGQCRRAHDVCEVRTVGVYDVILPVVLEYSAVGLK